MHHFRDEPLKVAAESLVPVLVLLSLLLFGARLAAADNPGREGKQKPIVIKGAETKPVPQVHIPKVPTGKEGIPEIPKPITRGNVGPAEKVRLDEVEQQHAQGKITETEKDLEKDVIARESNVKF